LIIFFSIAYFIISVETAWSADHCVSNATELQTALTTAESNGEDDTIRVVEGTYAGNFSFESGETYDLTILGGHTSGCGLRKFDPANTVLDGGAAGQVLNLYSAYDYVDIAVEGLTLQNGYTSGDDGGGIYVRTLPPLIGGNINIRLSIIQNNTALVGGGVYVRNSGESGTTGDIVIANNFVLNNTSTTNDGGLSLTNDATTGTAGDIVLINNVVANNTNQGAVGGGVQAESSADSGTPGTITLTNNTITGNSASTFGGGISLDRDGTINCYNNIISGNTSSAYFDIRLVGTAGTANGYGNNYDTDHMAGSWDNGDNNINVDPLFMHADAGDYRLKSRSQCIDSGETQAPGIPNKDIEGNSRPVDGDRDGNAVIDMGAYEYLPRSGVAHIYLLLN